MARQEKCLYYKFKETLLALDASIDFDELKELEAHVNYESFMKESLACETVYKTKNSTLDIPGLPDCLFGSLEQSALTRAKATLLMTAMLETVANEQESTPRSAGKQAQDKTRKNGERHVSDEPVRIVENAG